MEVVHLHKQQSAVTERYAEERRMLEREIHTAKREVDRLHEEVNSASFVMADEANVSLSSALERNELLAERLHRAEKRLGVALAEKRVVELQLSDARMQLAHMRADITARESELQDIVTAYGDDA